MTESQITGVGENEFTTEVQGLSASAYARAAVCPRPVLSDTIDEG
jgi:hypothetical protein